MSEPLLFGVPLTLMFLYFVWYSFLGWVMESTYCSVLEHHWINRGFLHMTICPIYGVGVLMMICFFTPLTKNPLLFYLVATLVMSAWEYFVGWLLEVTTHMKYWDYSHRRFNLKGRICLGNCLWWGVASYLVIYWLHPATQRLFLLIPTLVRQIVALVLALLVLADTIATIRELALLRAMLTRAEEARVQLELMKAELHQSLDEKRSELQSTAEKARQSLDEKRSTLQATLESTAEKARQSTEQRRENRDLAVLEANRRKIMEQAERYSRRFLKHYGKMSSRYFSNPLTELRRKAGQLRHLKRDDRTRG
jgi:uncharacterized membrane protein